MNDRAKLYHALLKRVARELNEKPDAEVVKHVATFRLLRESLQVRLLDGERVDPGDLFKVDEVLKQYLPQGKPLKAELVIVEGVHGVYKCRFCGKENELKPGEYTPAKSKPDKPPPVIEGSATEVTPSAKPDTDKAENKPTVAPKAEKPQQSPKWQGEGDRAFMPAVNFVEGVEGWTKRPSVWRSRGNSQALFGPHGGGLRANPPSPPTSQACQSKNYR